MSDDIRSLSNQIRSFFNRIRNLWMNHDWNLLYNCTFPHRQHCGSDNFYLSAWVLDSRRDVRCLVQPSLNCVSGTGVSVILVPMHINSLKTLLRSLPLCRVVLWRRSNLDRLRFMRSAPVIKMFYTILSKTKFWKLKLDNTGTVLLFKKSVPICSLYLC